MAAHSPESNTEGAFSARIPGNRINVKMAGISLMLAIFFWLIFTLRTQVFVTTLSYPVAIRNMPPGTDLAVAIPERLRITAEGTGNRIFLERYKFSDDTIFIDYRRWSGMQYFTFMGQGQALNSAQSRGIRILSTQPDTIPLRFVRSFTKKVPVRASLGHGGSGTIRIPGQPVLFPDSVLIQGDEKELSRIQYVGTSVVKIPDKPGAFRTTARILCPSEMKSHPPEVEVNATAEPFTEKRLELQPEIRNLPPGYSVRLNPVRVTVFLLIPEKDFAKANPGTVKAVVDFSSLKEGSRFIVPQIETRETYWESGRIQPQALSFILTHQ